MRQLLLIWFRKKVEDVLFIGLHKSFPIRKILLNVLLEVLKGVEHGNLLNLFPDLLREDPW